MSTREEKIALIQAKLAQREQPSEPSAQVAPLSREEKIALIQQKSAAPQAQQTQAPQSKADNFTVAVRNGLQGAFAGISDEVAGGVEAAGRVIGVDGAGGEFKGIKLSQEGPTLDWEILRDAYKKARDKEREALKKDAKDSPALAATANIAGAIASPIAKIKALQGAGTLAQGTAIGTATGFGSSNKDLIDDPMGVLKDTATGGAFGLGAGVVMKGAGAGLKTAGKKLGGFAERTAENATGATGLQASKFEEGAGRKLLDGKHVRFGDNQAKIAARLEKASEAANKQIDDALSSLEAQGIKIDENKIVERLTEKITKLKSDPSQADIAKILEKEIENIVAAGQARGTSEVGVKVGEQIKRGYNRKAGNWLDPEKSQAGKTVYQEYRGAVEGAARKANPDTAKAFEEGKKTYGLLAPIKEAAERRAATTNQSPLGGLLDVSAGIGGFATGGPVGAIAAPIMRRVVAPRISSSVAVTADKVSKGINKLARPVDTDAARKAMYNRITYEKSAGAKAIKAADNDEPSVRPLKGNEKWANDGFNKAIEAKPELSKFKGAMLSNPKAKNLLIEMSDLKPGTPRFNAALSRLEEMGAKN